MAACNLILAGQTAAKRTRPQRCCAQGGGTLHLDSARLARLPPASNPQRGRADGLNRGALRTGIGRSSRPMTAAGVATGHPSPLPSWAGSSGPSWQERRSGRQ